MTSTGGRLALFLLVGAGYAAGSRLSFTWFGADGTNASFFPAAGVTVAALLLVSKRDWPIVVAAAASAEFLVDLAHDIAPAASAGYVVANITQPLVGALLLLAVCERVDLGRTEDLVAFIACAVVVGPAVGGALGASTYVLIDGGSGWFTFAAEWWVGDGLGVLVVGGAIVALRSRSWRPPMRRWLTEAAVLIGAVALSALAVFRWELFPFTYLPIVLLVASAFRLGTAGVALGGAAIAFVAAEATADGHTFWESLDVSPSAGLLYLQLALAVSIATTLALAAEIHQREQAARAWAEADSARRESAAAAARADRLRRLAEALGRALTTQDVVRTTAAHELSLRHEAGDDDEFLVTAARQLGEQAFERARLHEAEHAARRRSELLERNAAHLAAAVTARDVAASTIGDLEAAGFAIAGIEMACGKVVEVLAATGVSQETQDRYHQYPIGADTPGADVIRSGRAIEISSAEEYDQRYPGSADLRRQHAVEAVLAIPLRGTDGRILGSLSAAFPDRRSPHEGMRQLLVGVGEQTGLALERALLAEAERTARRHAERLQALTEELASAVTVRAVGEAVARHSVRAVDADGGIVVLSGGEAETQRVIASRGYADGIVAGLPASPLLTTSATVHPARRESAFVETLDELDADPAWRAFVAHTGERALIALPIVGSSGLISGALHLGFRAERPVSADERALMIAVARQAGQAFERANLFEAERDARARVELLQRNAARLAAAATVREVAESTLAELEAVGIDVGAVRVVRDGVVQTVAAVGLPPHACREHRGRPLTDDDTPSGDALRSGRTIEIATAGEIEARYPHTTEIGRGLGTQSLVALPLRAADGRVIGALSVTSTQEGWMDDGRRQLLTSLSEQCGLALDRAQLLEDALGSSERAAFLATYSGALDQPTTAVGRAQRAVELLAAGHAGGAALYLVDEGEDAVCIARSGGDDTTWARADRLVSSTVAAGGPWPAEETAGQPGGAVLAVPLRARKRTLGALALTGGELPGGRVFLREIAERTALAIDNALLYEHERDASHTLQHGLLGDPLPSFDGVELAYAYRPGSVVLEVGGDWYDAFPLPEGRIALVIGDVVGHGLDAAVAMGQLRGAVRALGPASSPAELLDGLDVFVSALPDAAMATLAYVEFDPSTGIARYACAGHPPPLVCEPDGHVRYLWDGRSPPLGVRGGSGRSDAAAILAWGDTLMLYTDGLVEKRHTILDDGLDGLLDATRILAEAPFDQLVDRLLDEMVDESTQDDDVCVIVAKCSAAPTAFRHTARAQVGELARLRQTLRSWLASLDIDTSVEQEILLAVGEAATNAIEHGYGMDGTGLVGVDAALDRDGDLLVLVRDQGTWLDRPADPSRGRGDLIMRALMDDVEVHTGPSGTEVRLCRRLRRSVPA